VCADWVDGSGVELGIVTTADRRAGRFGRPPRSGPIPGVKSSRRASPSSAGMWSRVAQRVQLSSPELGGWLDPSSADPPGVPVGRRPPLTRVLRREKASTRRTNAEDDGGGPPPDPTLTLPC